MNVVKGTHPDGEPERVITFPGKSVGVAGTIIRIEFREQFQDPHELAEDLKDQGLLPPEAEVAWFTGQSTSDDSGTVQTGEATFSRSATGTPCPAECVHCEAWRASESG